MCGIAGFVTRDGRPAEAERLRVMAEKLVHRGPDGQGIWNEGGAGLAHRRLAIVDLSENGAQPMVSADGRYAITFNGEIYNYQELRDQLSSNKYQFRSTSDTEVLLALYAQEGEKMLEKLRGMFAFAIWDTREQKLFFARDRIGKKPFFYREDGDGFAFASEAKALVRPGHEIDWDAVRLFLGLQYVPSPRTGWKGIQSLPPGHCGEVADGKVSVRRYHAFERTPKLDVSFDEAAQDVRRLLEEAVRYRLIADVPVGVFLSGGIDSSAIACLAAREAKPPLQTFTMGFPSLGHDERGEARSLAVKLGAKHHEFEARPEDALAIADELIGHYDQPYADSSALPVWLLSRETRKSVKAVLAGDGGDELFGGYRRYQYFLKAERLKRLGLAWLGANASWAGYALLRDPRVKRFAAMLESMKDGHGAAYGDLFTGSYFNRDDVKRLLVPEFFERTVEADAGSFVRTQYNELLGVEGALDFDLRSYLPDDLNVKMDRASMSHGLEARAPFLDQELVSYAARLPSEYLLRYGEQKPLLNAALRDLVPNEIFARPKRGFQVPLADWFRNELRSVFVERCLSSDASIAQICRMDEMKKLLNENDKGRDHGNRLWMLLSLSTWLERYA